MRSLIGQTGAALSGSQAIRRLRRLTPSLYDPQHISSCGVCRLGEAVSAGIDAAYLAWVPARTICEQYGCELPALHSHVSWFGLSLLRLSTAAAALGTVIEEAIRDGDPRLVIAAAEELREWIIPRTATPELEARPSQAQLMSWEQQQEAAYEAELADVQDSQDVEKPDESPAPTPSTLQVDPGADPASWK